MSHAEGIHDHPTLKLGKRPPPRKATLNVAEFFKVAPTHPLVDVAPPISYPMDRNDVAGDCVVAAVDHALQAQAALLGTPRQNWTDAQLLAFYQTQNPGFRSWSDGGGPDDGGMYVQQFLEHLVSVGEILAFGAVDHDSEDMLKAGVYVGLAIVTGEVLDVAQQAQAEWDYVPGSGTWGGHATCSVAYDPDRQGIVTWGSLIQATDAFVEHQVDEAWLLLTTDLVNHPGFRNAFDLPAFAQAIADLTNGKVVVPVDPIPPAPGPDVDPLADFPFKALDHWASRPHVFRSATVARNQYRAWKSRHGL